MAVDTVDPREVFVYQDRHDSIRGPVMSWVMKDLLLAAQHVGKDEETSQFVANNDKRVLTRADKKEVEMNLPESASLPANLQGNVIVRFTEELHGCLSL